MKVLFTFGGLVHYYNFVLNKLNSLHGLEVVVVTPPKKSKTFGEGVYQTKYGINFKHIELEEHETQNGYFRFKEMDKVLSVEKPDVVVVIEPYLRDLFYHIPTFFTLKKNGIKLILKDHPFRLLKFEELKKKKLAEFHSEQFYLKVKNKLNGMFGKILNAGKFGLIVNLLVLISAQILTPFLRTQRILNVYIDLCKAKFFFNFPDALVCYIEDAFEIFGTYGVKRKNIFITYNSPDTDHFFKIKDEIKNEDPLLPKNENRLIHTGRLVAWKKVDLLIKAFAVIKKKFSNAELLIIGYGPEEENLKQLSKDLHVDQSVIFLGGVYDPKQLGHYLMESSIYVLAGMGGISINDAMCFGLPVICSVCDGTEKKLVRDEINGKFFQENDEADLAEKILYLLSDKKLLKIMGENSEKIIANDINIHTVVNGYVSAFEYVTKSKLIKSN
ncbi:MAG TPA: glycosyltransferase family 4 protein [Bacteroidia bacterium]|nr:glycosyltransferase family 4 protein [Bacteroidia bacterium]HNU34773.1 glycosyltransferase family 4 protein [Bacteroidia bacterium]